MIVVFKVHGSLRDIDDPVGEEDLTRMLEEARDSAKGLEQVESEQYGIFDI